MSLVCYECGQDLQPSDSFPGREGGMIFPNVVSAVWVSEEENEKVIKWIPTFVQPSLSLSLCFECIIKNLLNSKINALKPIFRAYEAETKFVQIEKDQKGKWQTSGDTTWSNAYEAFQKGLKIIQHNNCLSCLTAIPGSQKTFFSFKVLDRVKGEQNLSIFGSYSWSNVTVGETSFEICFNCCRNSLPRIFREFSFMLRHENNPKPNEVIKSEIFMSPEVLAVLNIEGNA